MARILIVDDHPDWRITLERLLVDGGYQVMTAKDEAEALSAAVQSLFDAAVVDVRLHGDDEEDDSGISLALALKKLVPQLKVVLLTGYSVRVDQVVKSIRFVGVSNFVEKSKLEGDNSVDLPAILDEILGEPSFESELDRLSLSLELGQPIVVRTRGAHVCARRTNRVLQMSVPSYNRRAQEARAQSGPRFNIKTIGQNLFRDIFENCREVLTTFEAARAGRRPLCLSFEGAREFIGIPFEFIFLEQPADYLILEHPVTRFINAAIPRRKALSPQAFAELKGELRVLLVASNTHSSKLPAIRGVDHEVQLLSYFLNNQRYVNVQVTLIPTEEATLARVRKELKECKAHIFHYAGHGWYNESSPEESALYFWSKKDRQGTVQSMSAATLKGLLQDSEVRLAYFSNCYSTTTSAQSQLLDDDFLGISDAVIQAGIPSTLGFRWPVSDAGAPRLAEAFYRSLLRQGSPEIALWEARHELATLNRDDPTWLPLSSSTRLILSMVFHQLHLRQIHDIFSSPLRTPCGKLATIEATA